MAGPHYSLSSCSLLEFSLDPGALLVHLCVLSEKEEFVFLSMGSWSNEIALLPSLSKEKATVFKRVQEALERSQVF